MPHLFAAALAHVYVSFMHLSHAFIACVGSSSAGPELKLLHLRQYFSGEALKTIESLGYTASAYQEAMNRLERRYGGEQHQLAIQYDQAEAFPQVRAGVQPTFSDWPIYSMY